MVSNMVSRISPSSPPITEQISLIQHILFSFEGVSSILLGDIDNDIYGDNELVISGLDGTLAIFKGNSLNPIYISSNLGTISCITIGNIRNNKNGYNSLCVISSEGLLSIFDFNASTCKECIASHTFRIILNIVAAIIVSVNDIYNLVVACSQPPSLRVYQMISKIEKKKNDAGDEEKIIWELLLIREIHSSLLYITHSLKLYHISNKSSHILYGNSLIISLDDGLVSSFCELENKEYNKEQYIYSITDYDNNNNIISGLRPLNLITTMHMKDNKSYLATSTPDGHLKLYNDENKLIWQYQIESTILSLYSIDLTKDGNDELVICNWDGLTQIIDIYNHNIRKFTFGERCSYFICGLFSLIPNKPEPVFIYTTFRDKIILYHDISLQALPSLDFIQFLQKELNQDNQDLFNLSTWLYKEANIHHHQSSSVSREFISNFINSLLSINISSDERYEEESKEGRDERYEEKSKEGRDV